MERADAAAVRHRVPQRPAARPPLRRDPVAGAGQPRGRREPRLHRALARVRGREPAATRRRRRRSVGAGVAAARARRGRERRAARVRPRAARRYRGPQARARLGRVSRRPPREADAIVAWLVDTAPDARWFLLSDHGHLAGGGHGGEERDVRQVEDCIFGPGVSAGRRRASSCTSSTSRARSRIRSGPRSTRRRSARPLSVALAAPLGGDQAVPATALGRGVAAIFLLVVGGARRGLGVRRWWLAPWWFVVACAALVLVRGAPTLSMPMVYAPAGRAMYLSGLPALALARRRRCGSASAPDLARVLASQLALPIAALAAVFTVRRVAALLGAEVAPVVPRFTAWMLPLILIAAHGLAVAGLAVLGRTVRSAFGRPSPPEPPRSEPQPADQRGMPRRRGRDARSGRVEVVELDHVVRRTDDELIRPLDDRPLQLLVDHDRATAGAAAARRAAPARDRCRRSSSSRCRRAGPAASARDRRARRDRCDARLHARHAQRERHAHERRVGHHAVGVEQPRIVAERLAVVAGEHDDRRRQASTSASSLPTSLSIARSSARYLWITGEPPSWRRPSGRRHVDLVVLVDVEEVQPDEPGGRPASSSAREASFAVARRADVIADVRLLPVGLHGDEVIDAAPRATYRRRSA